MVYDLLHGVTPSTGINTSPTGVTINLPRNQNNQMGAWGSEQSTDVTNSAGLTLGTWGENSGAEVNSNSGVTIRLPKKDGLQLGSWG